MSTWLADNSSEANRPASFGGLSKTCRPVHREACQDLLGDASDPGGSIPAEVWELREGSRALPSLTAELCESRRSPSRLSPWGHSCPPLSPQLTGTPSRMLTQPAPSGSWELLQWCYSSSQASCTRTVERELPTLTHCWLWELRCWEPFPKWVP